MGKRAGLQPFPAFYRALTPVQKQRWLVGEECDGLIKEGRLTSSQVQTEVRNLADRRQRVSVMVPSPALVDDYDSGHPFPPDSEHAPMRRARRMLNPCEAPVFWPAPYLNDDDATYDVLVFEDERLRRSLDLETWSGSSPTAVAIQALEQRGAVVVETKLEPETDEAMLALIERHKAGNETIVPIVV